MTILNVLKDAESLQTVGQMVTGLAPEAELLSFENGLPALAAAREKEIDVAVLETELPELNGLEVLRRLKREKDTPVIMLTARDDTFDKVLFDRSGKYIG